MPDVALATSARDRDIDPDLPLAVSALADLGVRAEVVLWDDPAATWERFGLVVVRSCWDYAWRRNEFLSWADGLPRVRNPAHILRWNTDKRYLDALAATGCPVVPTSWNPRTVSDLPAAEEWVVKPSVSAGSRDTARWRKPSEVLAHVEALRGKGRTAMVQPYVASVDAQGETALTFLGGEFSHAVRKGPLLRREEGVRGDRDSRGDLAPTQASAAALAVAEAALGAVPGDWATPLLYARVDVVTGDDESVLLLELELTEPSLFFPQVPGAADRFAVAVTAELKGTATASAM